ncbi:MAG: hypothetical protein EA383_04350 [Spirochaetaceae bacterium]|nr:MAG: hypothetical protein EA383_04350 [Spirochaetaceae bacterium]
MNRWTSPADVRDMLEKRWKRGDFLRAVLEEESVPNIDLPYRIRLSRPSSREMTEHFDDVRRWIETIRSFADRRGCDVEWKTVDHRQLGRNDVPIALVVPTIPHVASIIGAQNELESFRRQVTQLLSRLPETAAWIRSRPFDLLPLEDDLDRLIRFVEWMRGNYPSGMYLRQVDIPGIDTKFLEKYTGTLSAWLDLVLPAERIDRSYRAAKQFEQRYGFSRKPDLVRFRLLDSALVPAFAGFADLSVTATDFSNCPFIDRGVKRLFVVENDISALALSDTPDAIAVFGRGYYFDYLAEADWLAHLDVHYWGDIDTHGFAILNQFREYAPHARSLLMDRETLLAHRTYWTREPRPFRGTLERLTEHERTLYGDLASDTFGDNVRLEQERIRFGTVRMAVQGTTLSA